MPEIAPSAAACTLTDNTKSALQDDPKKWPSDTKALVFCAVLGLVLLVIAALNRSVSLPFKPNLGSHLPVLLGSLLVVALLVERVVEVFITAWKDREAMVHEQNRDYWQARKAQLEQSVRDLIREREKNPPPDATRLAKIDEELPAKRAAIAEAEGNVDTEDKALLPYKARTRKLAIWISLVIGLFTAAVGFRLLAEIVDYSSLTTPFKQGVYPLQLYWFVTADVLLTGTVLSGGSKAIHQVFSVYEAFMQSTQKSVASRAP